MCLDVESNPEMDLLIVIIVLNHLARIVFIIWLLSRIQRKLKKMFDNQTTKAFTNTSTIKVE